MICFLRNCQPGRETARFLYSDFAMITKSVNLSGIINRHITDIIEGHNEKDIDHRR